MRLQEVLVKLKIASRKKIQQRGLNFLLFNTYETTMDFIERIA